MKFVHPNDISREFERLVKLVDHPVLHQLEEGLWTRQNESEIWLSVGKLARLLYVNVIMTGKLKAEFENIIWGLARMEIHTSDESFSDIPIGSPVIMNKHKWDEARDVFANALATWSL
jgi:hypothetical protein